MGYFLFVFGEVPHEPNSLVFDLFGITIGEEELFADEFLIVFRSCVWGLVVGE
jgi:hypothetical protein